MTTVYLTHTGKDFHGADCDCGKCNGNGHSYGVAITKTTDNEPFEVCYAPSERAAENDAKIVCWRESFDIVPQPEPQHEELPGESRHNADPEDTPSDVIGGL